jgi:hypothetical protein
MARVASAGAGVLGAGSDLDVEGLAHADRLPASTKEKKKRTKGHIRR